MSEVMLERGRRAERELQVRFRPDRYLEKVMYESLDFDLIPDFLEEIDLNPRTTDYRFNYVYELYVVGCESRRLHPYL